MEEAQKKNQDQVTLNLLTISLLKEKESVAYEILQKYHVDVEELIYLLQEKSAFETPLDQISTLVNINKKVKNKKYKIIGRENEIEQICTILSKKEKNNVLIIGEAGVGKSAIVEKLAMMINHHQVVDSLKNKIIYELSLSSLVAGTKYRGEFEEKFKKIIDKVKNLDNVIIFIDEIHNVIGAGGAEGAIDASNILKPYLARKDMTVIGATTIDEYYKHFEKDHAMNRRFSLVTLKENTKEETFEILKGIKCYYENFHHIKISDTILKELINLVDQHIKNRTYPDKAIDILDLSCVKAKFYHEQELTKIRIIETIEKYLNITIHQQINKKTLEKQLNKNIFGQEKAIHQLVQTLETKKLPHSFFLYGQESTGKTTTAKILARELNYHYLKLDMNQYKDIHAYYKLIGNNQEPSILLSTLQSTPHTVLYLKNIDQDENVHDVTYENVQARERTEILMNKANQIGGLVIGTGDLSEVALGWSTYNGDHMSMYAVNVSVPKTLVRYLVDYVSSLYQGQVLETILQDVLDTPVSPELLPQEDDKIVQKTEDIVGPYELHDFFIYHMVRFGDEPCKLYKKTKLAFKDKYDKETIKKMVTLILLAFLQPTI